MNIVAAREKYTLNNTVYVLNGNMIISSTLLGMRPWTEQDVKTHPDMSLKIGQALLTVEVHSIADDKRSRYSLGADMVFASYAEADDAWQKREGPPPPSFKRRSREERLHYN